MTLHRLAIVLTLALATSSFSNAAVIITIEESGSDVTATLSGSITNWTGATQTRTGSAGAGNFLRSNNGSGPVAVFGTSKPSDVGSAIPNFYYNVSAHPINFGTNTNFFAATTSTASTLLFVRGASIEPIFIAQSYVLGDPITGVLTWAEQSFQSMGLTQGSYVWSWGDPSTPGQGDTITLNIVPEPATFALAAVAGLGLLACRFRR